MGVVTAFAKRSIALVSLPLTILILAQFFSPVIRDKFVEIYAVAVFIAMLCRFGADQFLYKTVSNEDPTGLGASPYLRGTFLLSFILAAAGLLFWLLLIPSALTWSEKLTVAAAVCSLILLMGSATMLQMAGSTLLSSLSYPTFFLVLVLAGKMSGLSVVDALLAASAISVVICCALLFATRNRQEKDAVSLGKLPKKLTPFAALSINKAFFDWGVSVYLIALLNPGALTIYVIANRLAAMLSIPANSLNAYLLREFSVNLNAGDVSANRQLMMQSIRLCLVTQAAIVIVYALSFPLLTQLFKVDGAALASVLIPLSIAQIIHGLTGPVGSMLLMSGHEKLVATISVSIAMGSMVFGYLATLWFGLAGLGIAIGAMLILQNVLYVFVMWRTEKYLPFAGAIGLERE